MFEELLKYTQQLKIILSIYIESFVFQFNWGFICTVTFLLLFLNVKYCKFGNFREGFIFVKLR